MKACTEFEMLVTGYLDGELNSDQQTVLMKHLEMCADCRKEMERGKMVHKALEMAAIRTPEDDFWDGYRAGIYNRLERNTGWILMIIGAIILTGGALVNLFHTLLLTEETPMWIAAGGVFGILGVTVLIVSLVRERLRAFKHERYKDVRR